MSRRRPNSNMGHNESPKSSRAQRHRPQPSVEQPNLGMSPEARYNHNLKVLRRRDPSIISIFDQFSHVCVYHHNGQTWEKNGFEGSMFLYESDSYPPYGFYILNRMGMDDYIQRLYPEDVTGIHGTYLMLRSYPDFTTRRISHVLGSHDEPPGKFSDAWIVPNLDKLLDGDKGRAHTVGLWMFPTDAREPMIDVMMRLHSYVKQNVPYPEQFRYGPNRPPPPNPHLRTTSPSPPPEPHAAPSGDHGLDRSFPSGSASELDQLFARMRAAPSPLPPLFSPPRPASSTVTVASLFAALGGADPQESKPPPTPSSSGIPLLDSIFASAGPSKAKSPPAEPLPIHSPTPQILNHEVITTLLGLPPSRSTSASSASHSSGDAHSHTSSREGDNEYEESPGSARGYPGSDGFSESSTVLDPDAELDEELQAAGSSAGRPLLSVPAPRGGNVVVNGAGGAKVNGRGQVQGDVTPRAPPTALLGVNGNGQRPMPPRAAPVPPPMSEPSISASTIRPQQQGPHSSMVRHSSAPFATSSDLWPGGRAPVDDRAEVDGLEEGEIVELDFADTSALSDPDAFRQVLQRRRNPTTESSSVHGSDLASPNGAPMRERRDRGKGRKKGKRERAAERAAEMEHQRGIEVVRMFQMVDGEQFGAVSGSSSRSASASPSPDHSPHPPPGLAPRPPPPVVEAETPTTAHPSKMQTTVMGVNGNGTGPAGRARSGVPPTLLDPLRARVSAMSTIANLNPRALQVPPMERNEFVRELLTLIHTDKAFVDALWQDYMSRTD
ncbi:hypothetical protein B0H16DRAFT_341938 [Mycena metata]|uniref:Uncharacterized protein n=1 Tax=Mycena metata TaxID=1033252 RepID=A0AAD7HLF7_9AGAR|nr:hypothetical protein B0H16DRAFT_341938 [Mycena metata]